MRPPRQEMVAGPEKLLVEVCLNDCTPILLISTGPNIEQKIIRFFKNYLVKSNRHAPLFHLNCFVYRVMERIIRNQLRSIPGVVTIYLSHGLAIGELYPGLSDFDLIVVFESSDNLNFYKAIEQRWHSLRRFFPVNDLSSFTIREFQQWQEIGRVWDPREELAHWRCIYGEDLRKVEWELDSEQGELDRLRYALAHFQNLMKVAIKEEKVSPWFVIDARRQLYKSFCGTVLPLDRKYLAIRKQRERLTAWISDHNEFNSVKDLLQMHRARFFTGNVSSLRSPVAALALKSLNEVLRQRLRLIKTSPPKRFSGPFLPLSNHIEAESRANAISSNLIDMQEEAIDSIMLFSTGSTRGYALFVILKDELSHDQFERFLVDIRSVFRVFDDPWFNEHFPAGIPLVCSKSTFAGLLLTADPALNYFHAHQRVLFGRNHFPHDLVKELNGEGVHLTKEALKQEHLTLSLHLHQIYLNKLKPALYDLVTCYLPRLVLKYQTGCTAQTAEEAVYHYARTQPIEKSSIPKGFMDRYAGKDVDTLKRMMSDSVFDEVWSFICDEFERLRL